MTGVRIDKWLWAARFFKTRALASEACESGRICCNTQPAKPSRNLKLNDLLSIRNEAGTFEVHVLELSETRGSAAIAQTLYAETDESRATRQKLAAEREAERKLNPQPEPSAANLPSATAARFIRSGESSRMGIYRKLLHAIDNHGLRGLLDRVLVRFRPGRNAGPEFHESDEPHPFDRAHATETSGHIPGEQLPGQSPADLYNTAYYGISPSSLRHAIELLPEARDTFTFMDLGCGKGRALLVAAEFPFAEILGVEISPELCAIARTNVAKDPRIRVEQHDATTVTFPEGPLVLYMYHPFLKPALRKFLANLERQRRHAPHPTFLLYANCRYEKVMAEFPFLRTVWNYSLPLSPEDAAADRHGTTLERYTLFQGTRG